MKTSVHLSDADLSKLVNSDDDAIRAAAQQSACRLAAPRRWSDVPAHVAALIADVLDEAKSGRLIWRGVAISHCRYCDARSEWKKPPRKKREYEHKLSGVEFADRFVVISGHISVGGCGVCVDLATPALRTELSRMQVQLPSSLRIDGAPLLRRWDRCRCRKCEWTGHEGQLGKLRTVMGDGDYPGRCPSCGAERRLLGPDPFEKLDGFDVVESLESSRG